MAAKSGVLQKDITDHLIGIRRILHQFPELGYQEHKTAEVISAELTRLGIEHRSSIARTGIIGTIRKGVGPSIVLRADIDALPLQEETGLTYASKVDNVMHACGHDVHTTMLLGAANLLQRANFDGTIKLVFQPSEEGTNNDPENKSGGQRVVESGELKDAQAAIALHIHPLIDVGKISFAPGEAMAAAACFRMTIQGKYAHAAFPHMGVDAILVATHLIQSAQAIVSRNTAPADPVVISFTKFNGGVAQNVIAETVFLEGTIRAFSMKTMDRMIERLHQLKDSTAAAFGATISLEFNLRYPSLLNDPTIHRTLEPSLHSVFRKENVVPMEAMLASEDFAFYSRKIPSMFYFLGAKTTQGEPYFLHHPKMQVNEECIAFGVPFLAAAAMELLRS